MGAVSSITDLTIYLSYSDNVDKTKLSNLMKRLKSMNTRVLTHSENFQEDIQKSYLVVYCIDSDVLKNYKQIREYNEVTETKKKIIYLFMNKNYTYENHPELKGAFPLESTCACFEEEYLDASLFNIQSALFRAF